MHCTIEGVLRNPHCQIVFTQIHTEWPILMCHFVIPDITVQCNVDLGVVQQLL